MIMMQENASVVALQFPEGLLMFALIISDILEKFCEVSVIRRICDDTPHFKSICLGDDFIRCNLRSVLYR